MGHDIIKCECGNDVMEGHNDWQCTKCGRYFRFQRGRWITSIYKDKIIKNGRIKKDNRIA